MIVKLPACQSDAAFLVRIFFVSGPWENYISVRRKVKAFAFKIGRNYVFFFYF